VEGAVFVLVMGESGDAEGEIPRNLAESFEPVILASSMLGCPADARDPQAISGRERT
jgi:hypothetical protein